MACTKCIAYILLLVSPVSNVVIFLTFFRAQRAEMILDELEQERCNKNLITINTKCTFGWPGPVEDPRGSGLGNP